MILDVGAVIFIILAMIAGYLTGGIREVLKLIVLVVVFSLFKVPSLELALKELGGKMYTTLYIFAFLALYFVLYWGIYFVLKGLVKEREGVLGDINKTIGVIAGFFRGIAILSIMVYILQALFQRGILIEIKQLSQDSLFYNIASFVLQKVGLIFF
ncbi:MAG: CvpA family protein [bacterium]